MTWQTKSTTSEATEQLGERLGSRLRGGEVIELVSDLGGGKTTMTRGIARGAGSPDAVGSPTFTLSREYKTPGFRIAHFDFYRLSEAGIVGDELGEKVADVETVVIVEWGDVVQDVLPAERLAIVITTEADGSRLITYKYPKSLSYLVEIG